MQKCWLKLGKDGKSALGQADGNWVVTVMTRSPFGATGAGPLACTCIRLSLRGETEEWIKAQVEDLAMMDDLAAAVNDNTESGARKKVESFVTQVDTALAKKGMKIKHWTYSWIPEPDSVKYLSLLWTPGRDTFQLRVKLNCSGRSRGGRVEPDWH